MRSLGGTGEMGLLAELVVEVEQFPCWGVGGGAEPAGHFPEGAS
jgi:hypothetical protein